MTVFVGLNVLVGLGVVVGIFWVVVRVGVTGDLVIVGVEEDVIENTALLVSDGLPSEASLTFTLHLEELTLGTVQA